MFLGSYYAKCIKKELQGKPYSKRRILVWDILEKTLIVAILTTGIILSR